MLRNGAWIKKAPSPYSKQQIVKWLNVIGYNDFMNLSVEEAEAEAIDLSILIQPNLANLVILNRLHLVAFPFETTPLHYSQDHSMDFSYEGAYHRLVVEGCGHYCFGKNGLLMGMLRALGYRVYGGQSRVNMNRNSRDPNASLNYTQLSHLILFVQSSIPYRNITYLVDTSFGVAGLTRPILLSDDGDNIIFGVNHLEKHRLRKVAHPDSSLENPIEESWRLEVLHETNQPMPKWKIVYSFEETEYFERDFEGSAYYGSRDPRGSRFVTQVVCVKFFWLQEDESKSEKRCEDHRHKKPFPPKGMDISKLMMGYISLCDSQLTLQSGPLDVKHRTLKTEQERIDVIRNVFGISLAHDAADHIRGRAGSMCRL